MVSATIWNEEWRSFPHGPDPASVWVIIRRGDKVDDPLTVLAQYDWSGGSEQPSGMAAMPPLNEVIRVLDQGTVLHGAEISAWPLLGQSKRGVLIIRHPDRDPWRATIRSWGAGFAARLTSLVDGLPPAPEVSGRRSRVFQASLFPFHKPALVALKRARGVLPLPRPKTVPGVPGLVASSREMLDCCEAALSVASTGVNVLIHGESGTGKEVLAKTIHEGSPRREGPFIGVNCAALAEYRNSVRRITAC